MKAIVLVSGGVDSTTCLAMAVDEHGRENVTALALFYGQKHSRELESAKAVAQYYEVEYICLDLSMLFKDSDCSLLSHSSRDIPRESYAEQLKKTDGMPVSTYVPFRNGLFLSVAASVALSKGCTLLYYGAHSDDAAGNAYPDCSEVFYEAMNKAVYEGSGQQLSVKAPFVSLSKADVVKQGLKLRTPYELTWSCYEGGQKPCGVCGTCLDRKAAFEKNRVSDPAFDINTEIKN